MERTCKYCGNLFDDTPDSGRGAKRRYCSPRCKKQYENSLRLPRAALEEIYRLHQALARIASEADDARRSIEDLLPERLFDRQTGLGKLPGFGPSLADSASGPSQTTMFERS